MKKSTLLVAAFLVGIATQANVKSEEALHGPRGNYDRYLSSQSVRFMQAGVLYQVFLDGSFTYSLANTTPQNYRGERNRSNTVASNIGSPVRYTNGRRVHPGRVFIDRFGVLHSIGRTNMVYKPNGKIKRIGSVQMHYKRGRLIQVGNMSVFYGRRGRVSHTLGNINRQNIVTGVCGVTPTVYNNGYHRNRPSTIQTRYTGLGSDQDVSYNDRNDDWNNYNSLNGRYGQRGRH